MLLLFAVAPAMNCTCANVAYQRAYSRAVEQGTNAYRHQGGLDAVRDDAIAQLRSQGLDLDDTLSTRTRLETRWKQDDERRERRVIELDDDAAGTRVEATRADETLGPPQYEPDTRERAIDLEAAIVRSLVPSRAGESDADLLNHEFDLAERVLYEEAARVLSLRGELVEARTEGDPLRTTWRETPDRAARTRYEIRVVDVGDRRRLDARRERERAIAGSRAWMPGPSRRDIELELALVDRRDPTAAAAIRSEAEREGQDAYTAAVDAGAPSCGL